MDTADLARFATTLGYNLPEEMAAIGALPPYLESDIDRLIKLNQDVRAPGAPYVGESGGWPDEHIVIGEDQCGNYWSVLRTDSPATGPTAVWFYDHDIGSFAVACPSLADFLSQIQITHKPEVFELGDWTVRAQASVGPVVFGMTPEQVRTTLGQPFSTFMKSQDSTDPTDAFDTLSLHAYYRRGKCEAIEFFDASNVRLGGHRLGDETFNDMVAILYDPVVPLVTTPTSCISRSFGVEFSIESADHADAVGAIRMIIVTDRGYYDRQDAALRAILGDDYKP